MPLNDLRHRFSISKLHARLNYKRNRRLPQNRPLQNMDKNSNAQIKWKVADLLKVIGFIAVSIFLLNGILYLLDFRSFLESYEHKSVITLFIFLIQEAIFIIPVFLFIAKKYKLKTSDLGFRKIGIKELLKWILKAYGIVILINISYILITKSLGFDFPGFQKQAPHIPLFGASTLDIAVAFIVLVFIAPLMEEFFFRGFLLQTFLQRFGAKTASFVTAAIFSIVHFEFQSATLILILALIINWLFLRTRSLWPCIGFHMVNNGLAFLAEWALFANG